MGRVTAMAQSWFFRELALNPHLLPSGLGCVISATFSSFSALTHCPGPWVLALISRAWKWPNIHCLSWPPTGPALGQWGCLPASDRICSQQNPPPGKRIVRPVWLQLFSSVTLTAAKCWEKFESECSCLWNKPRKIFRLSSTKREPGWVCRTTFGVGYRHTGRHCPNEWSLRKAERG